MRYTTLEGIRIWLRDIQSGRRGHGEGVNSRNAIYGVEGWDYRGEPGKGNVIPVQFVEEGGGGRVSEG